jgi:hypothetical protein
MLRINLNFNDFYATTLDALVPLYLRTEVLRHTVVAQFQFATKALRHEEVTKCVTSVK